MELSDPRYKFDDTFTVTKFDNEKFPTVARLSCNGEQSSLEIDVYTDLYSIKTGEKFFMALTDQVAQVQREAPGVWDQTNEPSLMDHFEYVQFGKLYKKESKKGDTVSVLVSFGGLLMKLEAGRRELESLHLDQRLYLLIKKVE